MLKQWIRKCEQKMHFNQHKGFNRFLWSLLELLQSFSFHLKLVESQLATMG